MLAGSHRRLRLGLRCDRLFCVTWLMLNEATASAATRRGNRRECEFQMSRCANRRIPSALLSAQQGEAGDTRSNAVSASERENRQRFLQSRNSVKESESELSGFKTHPDVQRSRKQKVLLCGLLYSSLSRVQLTCHRPFSP